MSPSKANGQKCLFCGILFPLYIPIAVGCPNGATNTSKSYLVTYAYPQSTDWLPQRGEPNLNRYAAVLPPRVEVLSMGQAGTPLARRLERIVGDTAELHYRLVDTLPRMTANEPAAGAPLKRALAAEQPVAYVDSEIASKAYSILEHFTHASADNYSLNDKCS